jgi:hypothetical protein
MLDETSKTQETQSLNVEEIKCLLSEVRDL